ncbi:hypothetical protein Vafri_20463 [Volvox africanus]|uniref:Uncharacterized protein n=1 Tax=Volvox africanus TaxID=51714 RepID=A0A8J4BRC4_9CHLO|nr:hypothetical protein Vafri_20463 [Volvox africanus]
MSRSLSTEQLRGFWQPIAKHQVAFLPQFGRPEHIRLFPAPPAALPPSKSQSQSESQPQTWWQQNVAQQAAPPAPRRRHAYSRPGPSQCRSSGSEAIRNVSVGDATSASVGPGLGRLQTPRRRDGATPRRPGSGSDGAGTSRGGNGGGTSNHSRITPSYHGDDDDVNDGGYGDTAGGYEFGSGGDGGGSDFSDDDGGGGSEGPLHPTMGEELRELERLYGAGVCRF